MKGFDRQQLLDCVSANELLEALATLKNIDQQPPEELELSFSQSSHSFFNTAQQNNHMDFELYMAIKNNPTKPSKNQKSNKKECETSKKVLARKSLTPKNKKKQTLTPTKFTKIPHDDLNNFKSRSHSPVPKLSKSPINAKKNPRATLNKENQPCRQIYQKPKINENSKKIIMEKEKSGQTYVPIHQRMNQVLREKQQRIAKIQKKTTTLKEIQDRECTFKPTINDWKKIQGKLNNTSLHDLSMTTRKNKNNQSVLENKTMNTENSQVTVIESTYQTAFNKSIESQNESFNLNETALKSGGMHKKGKSALQQHEKQKSSKQNNKADETKTERKPKYKNNKFNMLLDLIQ